MPMRFARLDGAMVDPANRLVAQTLETAWNARLVALAAARAEFQRRQHPSAPVSTPVEMRARLLEADRQGIRE